MHYSITLHYSISLWAYLSQMYRAIALHCMHYSITLWAYLSEPLVKDSHKRLKFDEKGYSLFAYSRFAYFKPKSGVSPTRKRSA